MLRIATIPALSDSAEGGGAPGHEKGPRGIPGAFIHVREGGLEPPRPFEHTDLNRARLPIPPLARAGQL